MALENDSNLLLVEVLPHTMPKFAGETLVLLNGDKSHEHNCDIATTILMRTPMIQRSSQPHQRLFKTHSNPSQLMLTMYRSISLYLCANAIDDALRLAITSMNIDIIPKRASRQHRMTSHVRDKRAWFTAKAHRQCTVCLVSS